MDANTDIQIESFGAWVLAGALTTMPGVPVPVPTPPTPVTSTVNATRQLPAAVTTALSMLERAGVIRDTSALDIRMDPKPQISAAAYTIVPHPWIYIVQQSKNYTRAAAGNKDEMFLFASQIAHEYYHASKQSRDEVAAYDFQLDALQKMNAPQRLIDVIKDAKLKVTRR